MDVTKEDLHDVRDAIIGEMRGKFSETHGRLDVMNGRVGKVERLVDRHDERIKVVEEARRASVAVDASQRHLAIGWGAGIGTALAAALEVLHRWAGR